MLIVENSKIAWNSLKKSPMFIVSTVVTMASTLGVVLLVSSILSAYFFKPLGYKNEDNIFVIKQLTKTERSETDQYQTVKGMLHWYHNQKTLTDYGLIYKETDMVSGLPGEPRVSISYVTPEYMRVFNPEIIFGRGLTGTEAIGHQARVVLISEASWRADFNQSERVLDEVLTIANQQYQIIGVVGSDYNEPHFLGTPSTLWIPFDNGSHINAKWGSTYNRLFSVGVLPDGVKTEAVVTELDNLIGQIDGEWQGEWPELLGIKSVISSLREAEISDKGDLTLMLFACSVGLLIIATINVSGLFFSRLLHKQKLLAIQSSLGARRSHLFQTLLAESSLISVMSLLFGLVLYFILKSVVVDFFTGYLPAMENVSLDWLVMSVALFVTLAVSFVFAGSAYRLVNYDRLRQYLQSGGKGTALQVSKGPVRLLVLFQVTVASVLLFVSSLILAKALNIKLLDVGADVSRSYQVFAFTTQRDMDSETRYQLTRRLKTTLENMDSVKSVAIGISPINQDRYANSISDIDGKDIGFFRSTKIGEQYFSVQNIRILQGRPFSELAYRGSADELIVTENLAKTLSPDGNVVGSVYIGLNDKPHEIVAVTENIYDPAYMDIDDGKRAFWPLQPSYFPFLVKMKNDEPLDRLAVYQTLKETDDTLKIWEFFSLEQLYDRSVFDKVLTIFFTAGICLFILMLTSVGIYGILNYSITIRKHEFGVKMAIGARRQHVFNEVIKETCVVVGSGIAVSIMAALVVLNLFEANLNAWMVFDYSYPVSALLVVLAIAILASLLPVMNMIHRVPIRNLKH